MASFETKYVADSRLATVMLGHLTARMQSDGEHPRNRVHSVYFDTPELRAASEVANGDFRKAKVRVRWYVDGDGACSPAFLECKQKLGPQRSKLRVELAGLDPARPLHDPTWQYLPALLRSHTVLPIPGLLQPIVHISYRRHRFVDPAAGLRLALDDDIRALRVHPRFARAAGTHLAPAPYVVFEVKGNKPDLPPTLRFVHALGARRRSFSKYGIWTDPLI